MRSRFALPNAGLLACALWFGSAGMAAVAADPPAPPMHDHAAMSHAETPPLPKPGFDAPAPGTYTLQRIMRTPAGTVLDVDARAQPLTRYTHGKITLLAFIYTHCNDVNGCPLAYVVDQQLKGAIEHRPELAALRGKVRLVSLSFDPKNDTPATMRAYGGSAATTDAASSVEWDFLTTSGPRALMPLLDGFGQDVSVAANAPGRAGDFSHMLKVFLIDRAGTVREIYSSAFLQPQVVLNDILTLAMESKHQPQDVAGR